MRRLGFLINPIAGMGGRVGLKGTDNKVEEARRLGAEPRAPDRALEALRQLNAQPVDVELYTYGGKMGEDVARNAGFDPIVVGSPATDETSAADTRKAVRLLAAEELDVLLFVGGDGTAVDVAETLDELNRDLPILGVPAGVKVYSSVFAVTPRAAGRVAATFERTETREVNDIDEDAFRGGEVRTELKALATVPVGEEVQSSKQLGGGSVEVLAEAVAADIEADPDATYILGPGSTLEAVKTNLGFDGAPLGVDVWRSGAVVSHDANEDDILDSMTDRNIIVVSPIGGQGFIFGRGNAQISPAVIRQSEVVVIATKAKLRELDSLRVDTGNRDVDADLRGWKRVRVGKFEQHLLKVV